MDRLRIALAIQAVTSLNMRVSLFDFDLPQERIASYPVEPRDTARLLQVTETACIDRVVQELPDLLQPGDVLVFNDSKVIPARLYGRAGLKEIEILLHKRRANGLWECFARPLKKLKLGDTVLLGGNTHAELYEKTPEGLAVFSFLDESENALSDHDFFVWLEQYGQIPLPPYIARHTAPEAADRARYQTVYAASPGSVAAPTAGLHFTETLLTRLTERGVAFVHLTLHVGGGTFLPVKTEDTVEHVMHAEWGHIGKEAAEQINRARADGRRITAVGTTSLRLLESAANAEGRVQPFLGETAIFITPGYRFKVADRLLTNFHLPKSTLFMLVAAFCGLERMQMAYKHAIVSGYRFYSYGDACLLERCDGT